MKLDQIVVLLFCDNETIMNVWKKNIDLQLGIIGILKLCGQHNSQMEDCVVARKKTCKQKGTKICSRTCIELDNIS